MKLFYNISEQPQEEAQVQNFVLPDILAETKKKDEPEETAEEPVEEVKKEEISPEKLHILHMKQEAEEALSHSLQQAQQILDEARKQSELIKQEAAQEAYQEGLAQGIEDGRSLGYEEYSQRSEMEIQEIRQQFAEYVHEMDRARDAVLEKYLDDLKNITIAIAEKIIRTSMQDNEEIIKKMIISATDKLKKTAWVKIYVGKSDNGTTLQGDEELLRELSRISDNVRIVMMEEEEPGTCIIELPNEVIDISTATQLENVKDILNNARV